MSDIKPIAFRGGHISKGNCSIPQKLRAVGFLQQGHSDHHPAPPSNSGQAGAHNSGIIQRSCPLAEEVIGWVNFCARAKVAETSGGGCRVAVRILRGRMVSNVLLPFVAPGPGSLPFRQARRARLLASWRREPLTVMARRLSAVWRQLQAVEHAAWAALPAPESVEGVGSTSPEASCATVPAVAG